MPTTITPGIVSYTNGDYLDEVKTTNNIEVMTRRLTSGVTGKVNPFNPTNEFSWKGGGNPAVSLGVAAITWATLNSGINVVKKYEHTEKNNDYDDFSADGDNYPGAS